MGVDKKQHEAWYEYKCPCGKEISLGMDTEDNIASAYVKEDGHWKKIVEWDISKEIRQAEPQQKEERMAMDADSGVMRMLQEGEKQKVNETLFEVGEFLSIKGCVFSIQEITPEKVVLHPEPKEKFHQRVG